MKNWVYISLSIRHRLFLPFDSFCTSRLLCLTKRKIQVQFNWSRRWQVQCSLRQGTPPLSPAQAACHLSVSQCILWAHKKHKTGARCVLILPPCSKASRELRLRPPRTTGYTSRRRYAWTQTDSSLTQRLIRRGNSSVSTIFSFSSNLSLEGAPMHF